MLIQPNKRLQIFSGEHPMLLVIGLVGNDAFNGTKDKNPFNVQHFNLVDISV